jgi:C-terminal processing protease CtpA/Prc
VKDLGGGVWCRVSIALFRDAKGTLPRPAEPGKPAVPSRIEGWSPTGHDRGARIAGVMLAWTVFQHFYPYFDVVKTDWNEALRTALQRAATDPTSISFLDTLREMVAKLHDGHGGVYCQMDSPPTSLPLEFAWVGDELVIDRVADEGTTSAKRGDVVLAIDGKPTSEHVARESRLISAATDGWRRYRLLGSLRMMTTSNPCPLRLRSPSGSEHVISIGRIAPEAPKKRDDAPKNGAEIAPGVFYFDMNGAANEDFEPLLPKLAQAKGIVFDMRGYPASAGTTIIRHLTKDSITSAQWRVPHVFLPDQENFDCPQRPGWQLTPLEPHLDAKIAFVTDGRAISYAESCMGIIENYKLGAIVGETTAGTNGNVNPFVVAGGYSISWTGMRVLKHDGSQHHGVGIRPTVPCSRTVQGIAAGRDELLEKAIEVVSR